MFDWFKKKDKQEDEQLENKPMFLVVLDSGTQFTVRTKWTPPQNEAETEELIKAYVSFLLMLSEGQLVPLFQEAIILCANNSNHDTQSARAILQTYKNIAKNNINLRNKQDGPLVSPTEAFK
jgi:hypothetical protein